MPGGWRLRQPSFLCGSLRLAVAHRVLALLQRTINQNRAPKFTMPQGLRECELAMTVILKFYDTSDVCRIFSA
jgi:hypothetical protein